MKHYHLVKQSLRNGAKAFFNVSMNGTNVTYADSRTRRSLSNDKRERISIYGQRLKNWWTGVQRTKVTIIKSVHPSPPHTPLSPQWSRVCKIPGLFDHSSKKLVVPSFCQSVDVWQVLGKTAQFSKSWQNLCSRVNEVSVIFNFIRDSDFVVFEFTTSRNHKCQHLKALWNLRDQRLLLWSRDVAKSSNISERVNNAAYSHVTGSS